MTPHGAPSTRRQCELLAVTRSSVYYEAVEPDAEALALMRRIDELHLKYPFFGSRMITQTLKAKGTVINRKRVRRLMRVMDLESTAPKPNTSVSAPDHLVYPYLLRGLTISRTNHSMLPEPIRGPFHPTTLPPKTPRPPRAASRKCFRRGKMQACEPTRQSEDVLSFGASSRARGGLIFPGKSGRSS